MRRFPAFPARAACGGAAVVLLLGAAGCSPDSVMPDVAPAPVAESDWARVTPRAFDVDIVDLWGPSRDRMFAVGRFGDLLVREGDAWRQVASPTTSDFYDIHGCDWDHVYATAGDGLFFFDGSRWRPVDLPDLDQEARVFAVAPDDVMVVEREGSSWHWNGRAWSEHWVGLSWTDDGDWLAGAPDGTYMALSHDEIAVWEGAGWNVRETRYSRHPGEVVHVPWHPSRWCGGGDHSQWTWAGFSDGARWNPDVLIEDAAFVDLAVGAGIHLAWYGSDHRLHVTHSAGPEMILPAGVPWVKLAAFPFGDEDNDWLVAAAPCGLLLEGSSRSGTLVPLTDALGVRPGRLHVWANGDFAAVAENDAILLCRGGRITYHPLTEFPAIDAIWGPSSDRVYAAGFRGELFVVADGTPRQLAARVDSLYLNLRELAGNGEHLWAACFERVLRWNGQAWDEVAPPAPHVDGLVVRNDGEVWAVGDGGVYRRDDDDWIADGPPEAASVYGLAHDPATDDLLLLSNTPSRVWRRHDGVWEGISRPYGSFSRVAAGQDGDIWLMEYSSLHVLHEGTWTQVPGPFADPDRLQWREAGVDPTGGVYVASETGGIYHLDTGGLGLWR